MEPTFDNRGMDLTKIQLGYPGTIVGSIDVNPTMLFANALVNCIQGYYRRDEWGGENLRLIPEQEFDKVFDQVMGLDTGTWDVKIMDLIIAQMESVYDQQAQEGANG